MTQLSTLKTRLSKELSDSDTIGKTSEQREEAINDACERVYKYRNWPELYVNTNTQAVDKIINMPLNMDANKTTALWFGKTTNYSYRGNELRFINQTDFLDDRSRSATITEDNDVQVIKISEENQGLIIKNTVVTATTAVKDASARTEVGQTFVMDGETISGVLIKLKKTASPTGTITASIFATSSGLPTGSSLGSGTLAVVEVTTTEEYHWVKMSSDISVTDGATLALTVTGDYTADATNYVEWSSNPTSQITGNQILNNGSTWSTGTGDMGFAIASDYYNFQFVKKFVAMTASTDDNGLSSDFDQAIAKLAAGMILENKNKANYLKKLYGSGNKNQPDDLSAYGILNDLWTNKRLYGARQNKRMKSVFEKARNSDIETWPLSAKTNFY